MRFPRKGCLMIDGILPPPSSDSSASSCACGLSAICQYQPIRQDNPISKLHQQLQQSREIAPPTMTRKRPSSCATESSLSDGLTEKWNQPKLQCTVQQQPCAAIDRVVLDDLIIDRCITMLHYIDRIFHERVNHRFAKMLQRSYCKMKISLTILGTYAFCGPIQRNALANKREAIFATEQHISSAFCLIFKRFKRFQCLKICTGNMENLMDAILDSLCFWETWNSASFLHEYKPDYIRQFHLDFNNTTMSKKSCEVIESFSQLLHELFIHGAWITDNFRGEKFWSTIAKCRQLRKFSYNPECDTYGATDFMQKCMKELKLLKSFSCGKNIELGNSYWLVECFSRSKELQNLSIANCYRSQMFTLSAPVLWPLFSRLKTMSLHFDKDHLPNRSRAEILKIVRALPEDGILSVTQALDNMDYHSLEDNEKDLMDSTAETLYFWLSISEEAMRKINLDICFDDPTFSFIRQHLKRVTEWEKYDGICVEQLPHGMRLHLRDGLLRLNVCRLRDSAL